jgi:glycosyl transferase family 25
MTVPPIWVISLERAPERRAAITEALGSRGLAFEFIDAVDGQALTQAQRQAYSHWRALFETGRGLGRGMLGCSLSHLAVYRRMLAEDVPVVAVLEDDVEPLDGLATILDSVDAFPPDWQVITLHSLFASADPRPVDGRVIADRFQVCTYARMPFGTQGYLINEHGARRVLDVAYPVGLPPDELLFRARPAGLRVYGIEPSVLAQRDVDSEIHRLPLEVTPTRAWRRPVDAGVVVAGKVRRRISRALER